VLCVVFFDVDPELGFTPVVSWGRQALRESSADRSAPEEEPLRGEALAGLFDLSGRRS